MYDLKILVPVLLNPQTDAAILQAKGIATGREAMITFLHVIENPGFQSGLRNLSPGDQLIKRRIEFALSAHVHRILSDHQEIAFELIVTGGCLHEKVIEKARELNTDLVILCRPPHEDPPRFFINTSTLGFLPDSGGLVLSVQEGNMIKPGHLMLPLFEAEYSRQMIASLIDSCALLRLEVTIAWVRGRISRKDETESRQVYQAVEMAFKQRGIKCSSVFLTGGKLLSANLNCAAQRIGVDLLFTYDQQFPLTRGLSSGPLVEWTGPMPDNMEWKDRHFN